jgi:hypothetical protein
MFSAPIPKQEEVVSGALPVCLIGWMDGWMCESLASGRLQGYYSFSVPKSVYAIGRFPANTNIRAPEEPRNTKWQFSLKHPLTIFILLY